MGLDTAAEESGGMVADVIMARAARAEAKGASVLVVDDDPEVREIVAEFLLDAGHRVEQAEGGLQALELLRDSQPDLVITDVRMPDMSGIELAQLIGRDHPAVKVILISGYFVSQQVDRRLLRKPFRMRDLAQAVKEELSG